MILVTGGAGYIGSHVVLELKEAGYEVLVLDNLSRGHRELAFGDSFEEGDLQNFPFLDGVFKKYHIEAVVHFAASSLVGESMEKPEEYYYNNVFGTLNLLRAMRINEVNKIVFSSTAAVYGEPEEVPIKETASLVPTNVYGETKLFIEKMLERFSSAYGLNSIAFRYFNAAGADPKGRTGEDHTPETHLIPLVLDTALGKRESITVFGKDYPTPDGTCIRDYIHVTDLASAHVLGLEKLLSGWQGKRSFNLGNGNGYSVLQIIESVRQVTGKTVEVVEGDRRAGDPAILVASSDLAEKELGWVQKHTDINEIVSTAWTWHQKRFNG
jgi:UDP-glucose 4-epimerase